MTDRDELLEFCRAQLGKSYLLGATGPNTYDCSSLILCGLKKFTTETIPRVSTDQYKLGSPISAGEVLPGDLVFFDTGWTERVPNHLGVVIGNSTMINANSVTGVTEEPWQTGYWGKRFTGARRIFTNDGALALVAADQPNTGFSDVPTTHQHFAFIEDLREKDILRGYADGTFRPDNEVSRAEALKIIFAAFAIPLVAAEAQPFADVSATDWHAAIITTAKKKKIISGDPNGNFQPQAAINRVEIAKMILKTGKANIAPVKKSRFTDVPTDVWYAGFAHEAAARGMFEPEGDLFLPSRAVKRGEMCRAIVQFLEYDNG